MVTGATGGIRYCRTGGTNKCRGKVRRDSLYAMARDMASAANLKALGVNIVYGGYDDFDSLLGAF